VEKEGVMRIVDVLKGTGKVVSRSGNFAVQYDLEVYEKEIRGWIRPYLGEEGEWLTLQMQNGSSLKFLFTDTSCTVTSNEGIIPAA
jgi:hypothetical protein